MSPIQFGYAIRAIRTRRRWRQQDLADRAGLSRSVVSRLERGHFDTLTLRQIQAICAAIDVRVDLVPRWRGGDLGRLVNAAHAALHESVARWFPRWRNWVLAPEVSFSIYGERGVIDILAWHEPSRTLLVIELKTDLVDLNELVGSVDRKRRLALQIAAERGWPAEHVGVWVIVASGRTNRDRLVAHRTFLRNAFPDGADAVRRWLRHPTTTLAALSLEGFRAVALGRRPRRVRAA